MKRKYNFKQFYSSNSSCRNIDAECQWLELFICTKVNCNIKIYSKCCKSFPTNKIIIIMSNKTNTSVNEIELELNNEYSIENNNRIDSESDSDDKSSIISDDTSSTISNKLHSNL